MLSKNTLPFFLVIPIFIVTSFAAFADELEPPPNIDCIRTCHVFLRPI